MREQILAITGVRDIVIINENEGTETILTPQDFQNFVMVEVEPMKEATTNYYCHFGSKLYSVARIINTFNERYKCTLGFDKFRSLMKHMGLEVIENREAGKWHKRNRLIIGKEKLYFISYFDYRANVLLKPDLLELVQEDGVPELDKRSRIVTKIGNDYYNLSYVKKMLDQYLDYQFSDEVLKDLFQELDHPFVELETSQLEKKMKTKKVKIQEKYFDRYRRGW